MYDLKSELFGHVEGVRASARVQAHGLHLRLRRAGKARGQAARTKSLEGMRTRHLGRQALAL